MKLASTTNAHCLVAPETWMMLRYQGSAILPPAADPASTTVVTWSRVRGQLWRWEVCLDGKRVGTADGLEGFETEHYHLLEPAEPIAWRIEFICCLARPDESGSMFLEDGTTVAIADGEPTGATVDRLAHIDDVDAASATIEGLWPHLEVVRWDRGDEHWEATLRQRRQHHRAVAPAEEARP